MISAILSRYAYPLVAVGLLVGAALIVSQILRIDSLKADLAQERKAASDLRADRERVAREHADRVADITATHALQQQAQENEYEEKLSDMVVRNSAATAESERLRKLVRDYASAPGSCRGGQVDAASNQRSASRSELLGALLEEAVGLVAESRVVIERRDAEVTRLLDQVVTDRAACSP